MASTEDILIGNVREYFKNATEASARREYNTAVTLLFKTMSALSDLHLLKKEGRLPSSHSDRFRTLELKYKEIYLILDRNFSFYQDSYRTKSTEETAEVMNEDARKLAKIVNFEL
ncbi:MAG: hypothetical protein V1702_00510 [Candidatus Woesearchaeota archaeon]